MRRSVLCLALLLPACAPPDDRVTILSGDDVTSRVLPGDGLRRETPVSFPSRTSEALVVTTGVGLTLHATITPPIVNGVTVQATDVQWRDDRVYASYNVRGDDFVGALQVIDVSDPLDPRVLSEALFPSTDISRLVVSGNTALVAGADATLAATFDHFTVSDAGFVWEGTESLPSYAATYVTLDGYHAHVTTGDASGVRSTWDLASGTPTHVADIPHDDARWTDSRLGEAWVISGSAPGAQTGTLTRYTDPLNAATPTDYLFEGGGVGAPTWATRDEDLLYVSADQVGVVVHDLRTGSMLNLIPTTGTANGSALSLDRRLAFLANGEEGLAVADVTDPLATLSLASLDETDDAGSANAVSVSGNWIALADGLGGIKILEFDRVQDVPGGDCDGDGIANADDPDDDDDGILDEDDANSCDPDLVCEPDEQLHIGRFVGDFYNLPCDHPDMEGPITGVVTGTLPTDYDWWDEQYYSFTLEREELLIDYGQDYFPVDEGLCGDPYYFAVHWYTTAIASEAGWYTVEIGSDDDSWLFVDDQLITDLGGIHALSRTTAQVWLDEGPHRIDIWFAERHVVQSGLEFEVVGMPNDAFLDMQQTLCLDPTLDADGDGVPNEDDIAPLMLPE